MVYLDSDIETVTEDKECDHGQQGQHAVVGDADVLDNKVILATVLVNICCSAVDPALPCGADCGDCPPQPSCPAAPVACSDGSTHLGRLA